MPIKNLMNDLVLNAAERARMCLDLADIAEFFSTLPEEYQPQPENNPKVVEAFRSLMNFTTKGIISNDPLFNNDAIKWNEPSETEGKKD